jgi:hypothetical protein
MFYRFIALVGILVCAPFSAASAAVFSQAMTPLDAATLAYCTQTGGAVVLRTPEYNTNGGTPLVLANPRTFCEYTAHDGSQIDVLGSTLVTTQPTLAALAYYAKVKPGSCEGSPGSCYCSLLGGTDLFGGINAAGGGWVNPNVTIQVLDACMFPDGSSIDSYGLFYHSAGIIRGENLAKVLRYKKP